MSERTTGIGSIAGFLLILMAAGGDMQASVTSDIQALAPMQPYIGEWRGVGQAKLGSNEGAWREESTWTWRFTGGRAELVAQLSGNKYYTVFQLQAGEKPGLFVLLGTIVTDKFVDGKRLPQRLTGMLAGDALVLTADKPQDGQPDRISLRLVAAGDRIRVLYEKRLNDGAYSRLAEVDLTRKGSSFAKALASGPRCVVTGGPATIPVEHKDRKYYVCCSGCRDYFREDPEAVLAEYRRREAAEKPE